MQCSSAVLVFMVIQRSGTLYALCIRCVGVQWSQMLIEYAAGPEGENNKCLKHFSSKQCWTLHTLSPHAFCQNNCNQVPCISTTNLQVWHWDIGDFFLSLWSCWAGIAVCRFYWAWYCRPICNAKSFWLTSLSKKCVVGAQFIVKQNADTVCNACKMQIQFAMRANADKFANAMYTLVRCELKCDPVSVQWMSLFTEFVRRSRAWS